MAYIKALRAPLPHLRIILTGGVDVNNLADFFKAGCPAVDVGSSLITRQILETNDWPELTRRTAEFVRQAKAAWHMMAQDVSYATARVFEPGKKSDSGETGRPPAKASLQASIGTTPLIRLQRSACRP